MYVDVRVADVARVHRASSRTVERVESVGSCWEEEGWTASRRLCWHQNVANKRLETDTGGDVFLFHILPRTAVQFDINSNYISCRYNKPLAERPHAQPTIQPIFYPMYPNV